MNRLFALLIGLCLTGPLLGCAPAHADGWGYRYERIVVGNEMLVIDRASGRVVERRYIEPPPPVVVVRPSYRPYYWEEPRHHHHDRW